MKKSLLFLSIFLLGLFSGKLLFGPHKDKSPALVKYNDKEITLNEVSTSLGEKPGQSGNTLEYKKQLAMIMLRNKVTDDLAKKAGLSTADFVSKIKNGAEIKITEEEINSNLAEMKADRKKLSKAQLDNILANMKEHKREIYFNEYLNKILATMKIEQND
jgi:hypothetical protein